MNQFFYADLKKKGGCYFRSTYNPKLEHKDVTIQNWRID